YKERQIVGFAMTIIGFLGAITVCALPMWKFKVFFGKTVTEPLIWEGLWMYCVVKSTGEMQCKGYDFNYVLPQDLQVARALMVIAIIAAVVGIVLGISAGKCINFVKEPRAKARVAIAAGIVFICAGILILITVSWSAYTISTGHNHLTDDECCDRSGDCASPWLGHNCASDPGRCAPLQLLPTKRTKVQH
uniref:Claudin n=1 Tax=Lates calcarifer TaxID=8187 RepID=A0A4W6CVH4_LATCA